MTQPPSQEVAVETAILRTEASDWDEHSSVMQALAAKVAAMKKGRLELGLFQVFAGAYDTVVDDVAGRSGEATPAMTNISATLRAVADTYDAEDQAAMHRIKNVY